MKRRLLVLAIGLLSCGRALAWGDLGHEVVGEIAERLIAKDAKTKIAVQSILGVEPLALAATWPDKVRNDARFDDFANYHFLTEYRDNHQDEKSALTVLKKYPLVLVDKKIGREEKMLGLRYLVHVMGDVHQPLHVGNEFDRGGNSCHVNWQPDDSKPLYKTNMHSVWDTSLVDVLAADIKKQLKDPPKYFSYREVAAALLEKHKGLIAAEEGKLDIDGWLQDASQKRKTLVYPDQHPEESRPYCKARRDQVNEADVPLLNGAYAASKLPIIERQLVLAGVHLANHLKHIFANSKLVKPDEATVIKNMQIKN